MYSCIIKYASKRTKPDPPVSERRVLSEHEAVICYLAPLNIIKVCLLKVYRSSHCYCMYWTLRYWTFLNVWGCKLFSTCLNKSMNLTFVYILARLDSGDCQHIPMIIYSCGSTSAASVCLQRFKFVRDWELQKTFYFTDSSCIPDYFWTFLNPLCYEMTYLSRRLKGRPVDACWNSADVC